MATTPAAATHDVARVTLSVLGIGALIVASLWILKPFLVALLWATMIVDSTWPLMLKVQAWLGGRRGAAVAVMTIVMLVTLFAPLYAALATIIERSDRLAELARELPTFHLPPPPTWFDAVPFFGPRATERWLAISAMPPDQFADWLAPHIREAVSWFAAQAGGVGSTVLNFLLTILISAILYAKGEAAAEQVRRFFRRLSGERGDVIVTLSGKAIRAVALGIVVTALIQCAIAAVGLYVTRVPFAAVISAVVLVLCIAQLGPILAMIPCVFWLYAAGAPGRGTALLVITLLAQMIDNVLRPILIKRGVDLPMLLILPGVIGGLLWLGVIGLFIGPVVLAVGSTLLNGWIHAGIGETAPERRPPAVAGGSGAA